MYIRFKFFLILIILICLTISSCTFNSIYLNEEKEKDKAVLIADSLYKFIAVEKFTNVEPLFSNGFYQVTNRKNLQKMFLSTLTRLGKYKEKELIDWKTRRVEGHNKSSEYLLVYRVTYEKYLANETISLVKENDQIKIIAYNVTSDGFLE